jgi:hypothetical protein
VHEIVPSFDERSSAIAAAIARAPAPW